MHHIYQAKARLATVDEEAVFSTVVAELATPASSSITGWIQRQQLATCTEC